MGGSAALSLRLLAFVVPVIDASSRRDAPSFGALALGGDITQRLSGAAGGGAGMMGSGTDDDIGAVQLTVADATSGTNASSPFALKDSLSVAWAPSSAPGAPPYAPHASDWVAFYCGVDVATTVPDGSYLDYVYVADADASNWAGGSGKLTTVLATSARLPQCMFRMFASDSYKWLGSSAAFVVAGFGGPSQMHLALTGRAGEMRVHWTSTFASPGCVRFGLETVAPDDVDDDGMDDGAAGGYETAVEAASTPHTYSAADMCEAPASDAEGFVQPGWLHEVVLSGLAPDAAYWYQIYALDGGPDGAGGDDGEAAAANWTAAVTFLAPPVTGPDHAPFSYLVYGDMGVTGGNSASATAALALVEVASLGARAVHHIGDISYARGNSATWEVQKPTAAALKFFVESVELIFLHPPFFHRRGFRSLSRLRPRPRTWWASATMSTSP
jgi:hypothetical protein